MSTISTMLFHPIEAFIDEMCWHMSAGDRRATIARRLRRLAR
jgi:hypothetical protein